MRKKSRKEITSIDEITVKLKPLGNIRPGVYLTILYGFIILCGLFFLLLLPGIRHHGAEITFTTLPEGSEIVIDGEIAGITPFTHFVPSGTHSVTARKVGFDTIENARIVDGRLIGSFLFPKKETVTYRMTLDKPDLLIDRALEEYSTWSGIDNFHERYQPPPVLTKTVEGLYRSYNAVTASGDIDTFLLKAAALSTDEALLKDYIHAFLLNRSRGLPVTAGSVNQSINTLAAMIEDMPLLPFWAAGQLNENTLRYLTENEWYLTRAGRYREHLSRISEEDLPLLSGESLTVEGIRFISIPDDTYLLGESERAGFLHPYTGGAFFIAADEISYRTFARFIEEVPEYSPSNRDELIRQGYVTDDYLKGFNGMTESDLPVAYVSYYAARAYCSWLNSKLPAPLADKYEIRLPDEYEWETAALFSTVEEAVTFSPGIEGPEAVDPGRPGSRPANMYGNMWEWCSNWYSPSDFIRFNLSGEAVSPPLSRGTEKSVRGGSWAVMKDIVSIHTRAAQPPSWCTPFVGFRPILTEK